MALAGGGREASLWQSTSDVMQLIYNCRETAFAMASLGATVVLGCRNIDAARDIISQIK